MIEVACPVCHLPGTVEVADDELATSAGLALDMHHVPTCLTCYVPAGLVLSPIDPRAYDVGPNAPRDELQQRLDAARALHRMCPPDLGPVRRWG